MGKRVTAFIVMICAILFVGCGDAQRGSINDKQLPSQIDSYLSKHIVVASSGGKVFSAHKLLGQDKNGSMLQLYVWAFCQEYYVKNDKLGKGSGMSLPVAFTLEKHNASYRIISHKVPGDGTLYAKDLQKMFPSRVLRDRIFSNDVAYCNSIVGNLERQAEQEAKRYFKDQLSKARMRLAQDTHSNTDTAVKSSAASKLNPIDIKGHTPADVMRNYLIAQKNKKWREEYNMYSRHSDIPPFQMFIKENQKSNTTLIRFEVGDYKLVSEERALVQVSVKVQFDDHISESKDEWWGCDRENGVWKIQWLPRQ
jgi:hypothetical protein